MPAATSTSVASSSTTASTTSEATATTQSASSETSSVSSEPSSASSEPSSAASHSSGSTVVVTSTNTIKSTRTQVITSSHQKSSTSAASPNQSFQTPHSDDLSTSPKSSGPLGMIVGLAVGIPLVLLAFGLLGFTCWRRRRNNKRDSDVSSVHPFYSGLPTAEKVLEIPDRVAPPADDVKGPAEMQGSESYTQRYPVKVNPFQNRPDLVAPPENNGAWSRETTMMTLPGAVSSVGQENVSPETTNFSPPYSPVSSQSPGHRPDSYSEFSPTIHQGAWGQGQGQEGRVRPVEMEGSRISTIAELPAGTPAGH
ncbi:hypothetical protein FKW77_004501 [Venturia effusa]|uniref:Mid2 domain-containing protein n=1 Tax=Venturia effusa TaxID=50376 RepID=A0A517KZC4_9PEZI|nr:hypothetical protein FKW77_004501 [Venturia effusa]